MNWTDAIAIGAGGQASWLKERIAQKKAEDLEREIERQLKEKEKKKWRWDAPPIPTPPSPVIITPQPMTPEMRERLEQARKAAEAHLLAAEELKRQQDPDCWHIPKYLPREYQRGCVAGICGNSPRDGDPVAAISEKYAYLTATGTSNGPSGAEAAGYGLMLPPAYPTSVSQGQLNPEWVACREAAAVRQAQAEAADKPSEVIEEEEAKQEIPQWAWIAGGVALAVLVLKK